ncbi:hypothetical protein G6O69_08565 [Pseudenhygromyxa sp. WMMC2535]|uniref:hypothetical protein n=1 Tax=Pseudenhygromyxa sp. WMMC2535 TaxID=2712867 RepID=UPI0015533A7C|nr:hypothetical protein [Pseudenhygromyxa sp. WMMC2535]NVB37885.1 hypothetical protein [Pseudenhygromyxa sp. WMMC2535]
MTTLDPLPSASNRLGPSALQGALQAHHRALLLDGRCPSCAELLGARSLFRLAPCPRCEAPIDPELAGVHLADAVKARGNRRLWFVSAAVGALHLVLGWIPFLGAIALLAAAAWIRVGILQPASAMLGVKRRALTRWTARTLMGVGVSLAVIVTQLLTLLPLIGLPLEAIISAGQVIFTAWAVSAYIHRQLRREAAGEPIAPGEWIALALALATLVGAAILLVLAFTFLIASLDWALEWLE